MKEIPPGLKITSDTLTGDMFDSVLEVKCLKMKCSNCFLGQYDEGHFVCAKSVVRQFLLDVDCYREEERRPE